MKQVHLINSFTLLEPTLVQSDAIVRRLTSCIAAVSQATTGTSTVTSTDGCPGNSNCRSFMVALQTSPWLHVQTTI